MLPKHELPDFTDLTDISDNIFDKINRTYKEVKTSLSKNLLQYCGLATFNYIGKQPDKVTLMIPHVIGTRYYENAWYEQYNNIMEKINTIQKDNHYVYMMGDFNIRRYNGNWRIIKGRQIPDNIQDISYENTLYTNNIQNLKHHHKSDKSAHRVISGQCNPYDTRGTWGEAPVGSWRKAPDDTRGTWGEAPDDTRGTWGKAPDDTRGTWGKAPVGSWRKAPGDTRGTWGEAPDDTRGTWGEAQQAPSKPSYIPPHKRDTSSTVQQVAQLAPDGPRRKAPLAPDGSRRKAPDGPWRKAP
jgi:hypothetical protein